MSVFKRAAPSSNSIAGTRPSPYNSQPLLSTGLASLDDIFGGGLPLSSAVLVDQDADGVYADLLLRFWIAQGVQCKQHVIVVASSLDDAGGPQGLTSSLMGPDRGDAVAGPAKDDDEDKHEEAAGKDERLKIAFRYAKMKQHAVTVPEPSPPSSAGETYCTTFDLTTTMRLSSAERARLHSVDVEEHKTLDAVYEQVANVLDDPSFSTSPTGQKQAVRIAMQSLSGPSWPGPTSAEQYRFLHRLRTRLRASNATAMITCPAIDERQRSRLHHAVDGVVRLQSFSGAPALAERFPRHNGLLHIPVLPALNSLTPPSARLSVLRRAGAASDVDNNLGFRVKRKKFVIETIITDEPVGGGPARPPPKPTQQHQSKGPARAKTGEGEQQARVRFDDGSEARQGLSAAALIHSRPDLIDF